MYCRKGWQTLNIKNIKKGDIFKKYADLCEALEEAPKKGGRSKELHLLDMNRFFAYEKKGHSFIIKEIYKNPISKKDNLRNLATYIQPMELYLLQLLKNRGSKISISTTALAHHLQMIDSNFSELYNNKQDICISLGVELFHIYDFMDTTTSAYKNAIKTILRRLEKKNAIMYKETYMVSTLDEQGKISSVSEATDYQLDEIIRIKRETMLKYGNTMQEIFSSGKVQDYYQEVNMNLELSLGIKNCYKAYMIHSPNNYLEEEYQNLLLELGINDEDFPKFINEDWARANLIRLESRQIKAIGKIKEGFTSLSDLSDSERQRTDSSYLPAVSKLNHKYINKK